jgi:hypothetical protein
MDVTEAAAAAAAWERRLRANPAFELVLFDRLPAPQRQALAGLARDPEHYGVLRPRRGSGLGLKSIDRETALLFLTLVRPGPLPGYVRSRLGDAGAALALARLVADGVLELEREPGHYVSGAAAMAAFGAAGAVGAAAGAELGGCPGSAAGADATTGAGAAGGLGATARVAWAAPAGGRLAELSRAALRYGEELARTLPEGEALRLSFRLYGFHRLPLTPRWRRRLPDAAAVRRFLGVAAGGPWRGRLERHWREQTAGPEAPWLRWQPVAAVAAAPARPESAATYKLYVSPAPEALPECFGPFLDALAAVGPPVFKVGAGAGGLLRPDKIVVYFASFERLAEAAAAVGERLAVTVPHGVPFSSEIAGGGLLSWGVDPPAAGRWGLAAADGRMSWRLWLTHRLARALIAGTAAAGTAAGIAAGLAAGTAGEAAGAAVAAVEPLEPLEYLEPWRFAVERLRLEGIDTDSWTPGGSLWRQGESVWP